MRNANFGRNITSMKLKRSSIHVGSAMIVAIFGWFGHLDLCQRRETGILTRWRASLSSPVTHKERVSWKEQVLFLSELILLNALTSATYVYTKIPSSTGLAHRKSSLVMFKYSK